MRAAKAWRCFEDRLRLLRMAADYNDSELVERAEGVAGNAYAAGFANGRTMALQQVETAMREVRP